MFPNLAQNLSNLRTLSILCPYSLPTNKLTLKKPSYPWRAGVPPSPNAPISGESKNATEPRITYQPLVSREWGSVVQSHVVSNGVSLHRGWFVSRAYGLVVDQ